MVGSKEIRISTTGLAFPGLPLDVRCRMGTLWGFYPCVTGIVTDDQERWKFLSSMLLNTAPSVHAVVFCMY